MRKYGQFWHIIITALVGIAFFAITDDLLFPILIHTSLFSLLTEAVWTPLGIAIYFALFAGTMYGAMYILCKARGDIRGWTMKNLSSVVTSSYKRAALGIAVLVLASGLFEFIYEFDKITPMHSTSYIFLIDDSGSMSGNDPSSERGKAIGVIMSKQDADFPYAVYEFSDSAKLMRSMAPYSPSDTYNFNADGGGTDILGSLETVLNDLERGTLVGAGKAPRILVLSDGYSDDTGFESVMTRCRDNNVVISTILCNTQGYYGYELESDLLENLAARSGGAYVAVTDVTALQQEMETAITTTLSHNLLSQRYIYASGWAYALMRIVFLSLIGAVWSWIKQKTYCCSHDHSFADKVFIVSCILCVLSSILVEVLFNTGSVPAAAIRLLFCTMWAICPGAFIQYIEFGGNDFASSESATFSTNHAFGSYDKRF